jgi:Esterase PHB depolymerase
MLRHRRRSLATALIAAGFAWGTQSRAHHDAIPVEPPSSRPRSFKLFQTSTGPASPCRGSPRAPSSRQFHIAFSKLVSGAGIVAGGPYGCVENIPNPFSWFATVPLDRMSAALVACTQYFGDRYFGLHPSEPKAADSTDLIEAAWKRRAIDDPANLADDRVWVFHGKNDEIVPRAVAEVLARVYEDRGVRAPALNVNWNGTGRAVSHGLPVARFTGQSTFPVRECEQHEPPFIVQCDFEAAEALFRHLYPGNFNPPSDDPHRDGTLIAFDQSEFPDAADERASLSRIGYLYVPATCGSEACRLHVAFHGCKQDVGSVHDDFIRDAGYNRWGASNNVVVLYPQAAASAANPSRCWDFWGYSGAEYYSQSGKQMRAVKAMVDRLFGN